MMRRRRHDEESGQSLVEFAMVLPMLLLILFAVIDFGRILQAHVSLTNAVREGARVGAVGGSPSEIQARVTTTASGVDPTVSATIPEISGQSVVVTASASIQLITPLGSLITQVFRGSMSNNFPISATADMRLE